MPNPHEAKRRLAELMEQRRVDLGLRWQDVADAGELSLKTLYSARQADDAAIASLTQRKIEKGLRWQPGSVRRVLDGRGDPEPEPEPAARISLLPAARDDNPGAAETILEDLHDRYKDDPVVDAIYRQYDKPARMRVNEILEWIEYREGKTRNGTSGLAGRSG